MTRKTAILDGDHGSDDFITTLMMLGLPDVYDLKGIITTRGNVSARVAARNAGLALTLGGRPHISVYIGAEKPFAGPELEGDDAFGQDGLGGATFAGITPAPFNEAGVDWLIGFLKSHTNVTLYVTGPLTTLATALQKDPAITAGLESVVVMGGALNPQGPHQRIGNITEFAEFNFYMDPYAADYVLAADVPLTLFPMDVTQQLVFSPERQSILRAKLPCPWTENLITMIRSAEQYDVPKFGASGAFFHDQHVVLGDMAADLYTGETMGLRVNTDPLSAEFGRMIRDDARPKKQVMLTLNNPDKAFEAALNALSFMKQLS